MIEFLAAVTAVFVVPALTLTFGAIEQAATVRHADEARLTTPLPPERAELTELPTPLSPMDLPARDAPATVPGASRVREPIPSGVDGLPIGGRRSSPRLTMPLPWPDLQARLILERALTTAAKTPTEEFHEIVVANLTDWWCISCRGEADHGRPHAGCRGNCACPCTRQLAEVAR